MNLSVPHFLRNLRIQRKLVLVILLTCATVLLLACAGMFGFQIFHLSRELVRDLTATAEIIAANSVGPILFKDKQQASDTLASVVNPAPSTS